MIGYGIIGGLLIKFLKLDMKKKSNQIMMSVILVSATVLLLELHLLWW